jgi:hypothetical protein
MKIDGTGAHDIDFYCLTEINGSSVFTLGYRTAPPIGRQCSELIPTEWVCLTHHAQPGDVALLTERFRDDPGKCQFI